MLAIALSRPLKRPLGAIQAYSLDRMLEASCGPPRKLSSATVPATACSKPKVRPHAKERSKKLEKEHASAQCHNGRYRETMCLDLGGWTNATPFFRSPKQHWLCRNSAHRQHTTEQHVAALAFHLPTQTPRRQEQSPHSRAPHTFFLGVEDPQKQLQPSRRDFRRGGNEKYCEIPAQSDKPKAFHRVESVLGQVANCLSGQTK